MTICKDTNLLRKMFGNKSWVLVGTIKPIIFLQLLRKMIFQNLNREYYVVDMIFQYDYVNFIKLIFLGKGNVISLPCPKSAIPSGPVVVLLGVGERVAVFNVEVWCFFQGTKVSWSFKLQQSKWPTVLQLWSPRAPGGTDVGWLWINSYPYHE